MTTIIFVRHGQSQSNLQKVFTGQGNTPLTEQGHAQARRTAEYLRNYPITHIYASDLTRTIETAKPTAELHGLEITTSPRLREIMAGDWEGKPFEELTTRYAESYNTWLQDIGRAHPEGGESVCELFERVTKEVDRIAAAHPNECVAIFSHATPMRATGCHWMGYPVEDMAKTPWVPNASVSIAEYHSDGIIRLLQYGYDGHQGNFSTALPKGLA